LGAVAAALAMAACLPSTPPAAAATPPLKATPDGRPLTLTFADEFDTFRPFRNSQGIWRTTLRDGCCDGKDFNVRTLASNKEMQLYVDPDLKGIWKKPRPGGGEDKPLGLNPFSARGGVLEITLDRTPPELREGLGGFEYVSGMITTQPSFSQLYGYFEMRAKLPKGKGVWPAFWLLPADLSWPPEIDVMENIGDPTTVYVTLHSKHTKTDGTEVKIAPDAFNTYAVSWTREEVVWFVNGREVKRFPTPGDMHKPMYMLANIAAGGNWAGPPDASTQFPARMQIDYIRAYRFGS
jgi:beta-glucanase (GH16 family)